MAQALAEYFLGNDSRDVSLLDGDEIREHLSPRLGFTKDDRDLHITRIGYIARTITKHHGIAICAVIAPYHQVRKKIRTMVEEEGNFFEIYVATPLETCAERDIKQLYSKAKQGNLKNMTGIDDPYEMPEAPDIIVDMSNMSIKQALHLVLATLKTASLV